MKEIYFTKETILSRSEQIKLQASSYNRNKKLVFEKSKAALLVTDMQKYFLKPESHAFIPSAPTIIPGVLTLIDFCIEEKIPVIFSKHINNFENQGLMNEWWNNMISKNSELSDIIDEMPVHKGRTMEKSQYDAFYQSGLSELLEQQKKTHLIACGVMTNLCCETTVRSAFVKGLRPFLPIDTTATYNFDLHWATIKNLAFGFTQPILSKNILES